MKARTATLGMAAALTIAFSGEAWAHAHLTVAAPADKSVVKASPAELDLTFSEALNIKFSGAKLVAADKSEVKTGEAMLMDGGKVLMIPVPAALAPGAYTVEWHVLSVDGHKTNGSVSFTVQP